MPRAPANKEDWTPFDYWWDIYPGFRKGNKEVCRKKFNKHSIEVQREIYQHTAQAKHRHPDWREEQFICAPEVYLNQRKWESPLPPLAKVHSAGQNSGAAVVTETDEERLQSLEKLKVLAPGDARIEAQLDRLKEKMNARDN